MMSDSNVVELLIHQPPTIKSCFLELLYAVLFQPVQTFQALVADPAQDNRFLFFAVIAVLLISAMAPMVHLATLGGNPAMLVLTLPLAAISGLMAWAIMGSVIGLLAYAFTGKGRIKKFLTLSGFATLPWLLMGPISLLKMGLGPIGLVVCVIMALVVWLWSVLLFALAITETYRMTAERVLIVLAAPFAMSLVLISWIAGFIENIRQLTPP